METRRLVLVLTGLAVAVIVVIGVLAAVVAGGGDGGGSSNNPDNGTPTVESSPLPERVEGELRLFGPDPITLDPACASDASSAEYIVEVFSGLVSFDRDLKLIPDIAEKWDISDDGRVYTFHLRNNVLFHDGSRRVTAGDFKFSMERALDPRTLSTVGEVYLDDIVGAKEFGRGETDSVSGIKVVNDNTLEITIDQRKEFFLAKLTYPTGYVVDQREVGDATCFEGANWTLKPNGSGPFKLSNWVVGQRMELEANEDYYLDPKPSLAKVTYVLAGGSPLTMYENNEVDLAPVGVNDIERIRDASEPLNKEFVEKESMNTFYIGFNIEEPPFDDPNVRKALAMGLDKETLATVVLKDLVTPAEGILPPGFPGFNEDLQGAPFDKDEARRLLNDAGGPDVLKDVTLLTSGRGASAGPILEAIIAMWEENLGVTIALEQEDFATFLGDLDEGRFQMYDLGWVADYPDPQNFLDIKFQSDSANNETGYSNGEVDGLLEDARTEKDEQMRFRLYQQAEQLIVNDSPWIPLYHSKSNSLIKPYVKDYDIPPFVIPNLRYVTISR